MRYELTVTHKGKLLYYGKLRHLDDLERTLNDFGNRWAENEREEDD